MASINKLSVRGVRSFSPEDAEQVLEFYKPLTIIVGANGCGKTTIIESLKFAVSGSMPPGNKSGQAFVHDPRSIGSSVVKANIKLRFTSRNEKTMVVVRSMEVQQKKTTLTFRQLDGVLRMTAEDGQRTSLSHKCSELDRQIPQLLGVSKAILENVVFCHQEESSWPLQEGAVLKKKFDDIFDSTRYSKALDVFSKLKKEYTLKTKDLKASVMEFKSHNHAAQGFQREIAKYNEQLEELEENLASARQALKENEEEQQRIKLIQDEVDELESKIEQKNSDIALDRSVINNHRSMLQEDLTGKHSLEELQKMLQSFDSEFEGRRDQKRDLETKMNGLVREAEAIREQQSELQSKVGRLQAAKENHEKLLRERYEKMVEIGTQYGLGDLITQISQNTQGSTFLGSQDTSFVSLAHGSLGNASTIIGSPVRTHGLSQEQQQPILNISQADMNEYFRAVARKQQELQEQQADQKARRKAEEDTFNNDIMEMRGKLKALDNDRDRIQKEIGKTQAEIGVIRNKTSKVPRMRKNALDDAKAKAENAAKKRDEANANPKRQDIPIEIASLSNKMEDIRVKLENDKSVQAELLQLQEHQIQIQETKKLAETELDGLLEDIRMEVNADTWRSYKLDVPPTDLPKLEQDKVGDQLKKMMFEVNREVSERFQEKDNELLMMNDDVTRLTQIVSEKKALLQQDGLSLSSKRSRMMMLQESVDKIKNVLVEVRTFENGSKLADLSESRPQELLDFLTERLDKFETESTEGIPLEVIKKVMGSLFRLGQKSGGAVECPCCQRDIGTERDLVIFQRTMKSLASADSPLSKTDEETKVAKEKYQRWCEAVKGSRDHALEYSRLQGEVDELEKRIRSQEPALNSHNKELETANQSLLILKGEIGDLREMLNSSKQWNDSALKIAGLREQVVQKEEDFRLLSSDKEGRDLKQVTEDIADLEKRKDEYIEKVNSLNREMSRLNDEVSSLAQAATRLETNLRNMQEKYDEDLKLEEMRKTLTQKNTDLKAELEQLSEQIGPLKQKVEAKEHAKARSVKQIEEEEERTSAMHSDFSASVQDLKRIVIAIDEYEKSSKGDEISNLELEYNKLTEKGKEKRREYDGMKPELERLTKMVDDQDRERKNLEENIKLIKATENIELLRVEIAELEKQLSRVEGRDTVVDDEEQLANRKNQIIADMARQDGRKGEIIESIRGLKRKLSQPEYKDVQEQYRIANIKHDTSEMAVKDIEKYHSALDKALQRYHSIKIGEINTIIRDLWTLTYKGEDINNIEIVSGQESGSRSSRSYNYRVVMEKSGSRMDMRGRCSAGQRVLASIVIRLALAETFCVNFGCIALDEPTVNLDYKNKKGLAVALAQIIASRQQQSNFQLVLITHDEDFVVMMKNELSTLPNMSMPEKYFQIHREEGSDGKYYSKIDAVDWEELL